MFIKLLQFLIISVLLLLIFLISKNIFYRIQDERQVNKSIKILREEVKKFDKENDDLNKLVKYFTSNEFQEKEIKDKLNLIKKGEKIIFVQGNPSDEIDLKQNVEQLKSVVTTRHANYYYWWKYFFSQDN